MSGVPATVALLGMGLLFMVGSFFVTHISGAFSRQPGIPAHWTHRVWMFWMGLVVFVKGAMMMFAKH